MFLNRAHLLRLSLPALTLLLGLFWYRRRRVAPADPGGLDEDEKPAENLSSAPSFKEVALEFELVSQNRSLSLSSDEEFVLELKSENFVSALSSQKEISPKLELVSEVVEVEKEVKLLPLQSPQSHSDSGILADESFTLNNSTTPIAISSPTEVGSPNKKIVSPSIDIPGSVINQPWHEEVEAGVEPTKLGSNPTSLSTLEYPPLSKRAKRNRKKNAKKQAKQPQMVTMTANVDPEKPSTPEVTVENNSKHSERDSANHSPVSGVLEGSVNDEARSEGSTDSGKGGSIKGLKNGSNNLYEFCIPIKYVGKLIGKNGYFLHNIKSNTEVQVTIKRHLSNQDFKLVTLSGSVDGITAALDMIRRNFPKKHYPELNLEPVNQIIKELPEDVPLNPELIQLSLVGGVNNDVLVCNVLKPNHFFVHMPTHPTYIRLKMLDESMTEFYESVESPCPPDELWKGMILVAKWYDKWVRVSVEDPDPNGSHSLVRLVDHGGFWTFANNEMRKIHANYLTLPFQAIEVFLANIQPKEGGWMQEAYEVVTQICTGAVGQAQVEGYVDVSTYISLYFTINEHGVISLADELLARDLAEPASLQEIVPDQTIPTA